MSTAGATVSVVARKVLIVGLVLLLILLIIPIGIGMVMGPCPECPAAGAPMLAAICLILLATEILLIAASAVAVSWTDSHEIDLAGRRCLSIRGFPPFRKRRIMELSAFDHIELIEDDRRSTLYAEAPRYVIRLVRGRARITIVQRTVDTGVPMLSSELAEHIGLPVNAPEGGESAHERERSNRGARRERRV